MLRAARLLVLLVPAAAVVACSSETFDSTPTNFAGNYTVNVTNDANGCNLANWDPGKSSSLPFTITQPAGSADLSGQIGGGAGAIIKLFAGTDTLTGTAAAGGFAISTTTKADLSEQQDPACKFQLLIKADAKQSAKDAIEGTLTYSVIATTGTCTTKTVGCKSLQKFNGSRPPT
jgi:hypothetical protein